MQKVEKVLESTFNKSGWDISKPQDGWEKGSYIAGLGGEKYFVKFGINPKIMVRLSDIQVTPTVISTGQQENEEYMVQEFIQGSYVPRDWLPDNLKQLANFIEIYHSDRKLTQIVKETAPEERLSIEGELDQLITQLDAVSAPQKHPEVREGIEKLKSRYKKLTVVDLVPVHDDPNTKNIFLTDNGLQMVDWNKIRLSDPLSDVGAILWWYVPPNRWEEYFHHSGIVMTDENMERIYLAAAKMTMGFTLWYIEHNKDYSAGLIDFTAAINKKGNPKA